MSPSVSFQGAGQGPGHSGSPSGLKPGKKTKGRVKIKMEFIENKLRRYTTFSKRKTGIMKKAYELSTLTGTQVMLLVASETGHVYTFATRKLQPMITSDSGKALIQTCLNSPDPPPGSSGHNSLEQRMNPSGFEETELTYSVGEEDSKMVGMEGMGGKPMLQMSPHSSLDTHSSSTALTAPSASSTVRSAAHPSLAVSPVTQTVSVTTQPPILPTVSDNSSSSGSNSSKITSIPLQFPAGLILQQTGSGQPVAIPASQLGVTTATTQPQTMFRTATGQLVTTVTNPSQTTGVDSTSTVTTPSLSFLSGSGATAVTPSQIIMYQTPQGVMYAAPTPSAALGSERTIFNFQQPATAISIPQAEAVGGGQQIITIPVPVSLASTPQVLQLTTPSTREPMKTEVSVQGPPTSKKSRK
ncbi:serum response factor-like [Babylonia areolata]|uniref:serum response factor-like n=1 Tax=Babylonia areolata TaxID=304850 RepID=UPI003FD093B8